MTRAPQWSHASVADRGLLSLDNLQMLSELKLPDGRVLEFILAVPGRRFCDFVELLAPLQAKAEGATAEVIDELSWQGHRLVVAHNPEQAAELTQRRRDRLAALQVRAQALSGKLDAQDAGQTQRGRKLSDSGAKARFFHEVCEAHLANIIRVDLKAELFNCKRSANPSIHPMPKLRTLRPLRWREGRGDHGSRTAGAVFGAGAGLSGLRAEGQDLGLGQRGVAAVVAELVRARRAMAGAAGRR